MTAAIKKAVRAAARAALSSDARFASFRQISAWSQAVSAEDLPAWAVATPRVVADRVTNDTGERNLTLAVIVKRLGDDAIEDDMDDDEAAAEVAIIAALRGVSMQCDLAQSESRQDGDGARRVGTLTMAFTVTYWVDDPA